MNLIARAIREHGWDAFEVSTLAHARSIDELMEMEKSAIILNRTMHPEGYNQLGGGGGWLDRPTTTGRPAWNKGIPHTDETKAKLTAAHLGVKNYRARRITYNGVEYETAKACADVNGLTRSQLARRVAKGLAVYTTMPTPGRYGTKHKFAHTAESKAKMSEARSGAKHYRSRTIEIEGKQYPSIKDAEGVSGYSRQQLKERLKDGRAQYLTESRYIAEPHSTKGLKHTAEARLKMSETRSGAQNPRARAIEIEGKQYPSILDASHATGYSLGKLKWRLKDGRARYLAEDRVIR